MADGKQKTIDGDSYVPSYINHLSNGLSWGATRLYMKTFGVGINDWRVLSALVNHPGATAKRVSEVLGMNKAIVSRSVGILREKELVTIEKMAREQALSLTPEGLALHDQIIELALERERRLLAGFSDQEVDLLLDFLRRMYRNIPMVNGPTTSGVSHRPAVTSDDPYPWHKRP